MVLANLMRMVEALMDLEILFFSIIMFILRNSGYCSEYIFFSLLQVLPDR